MHRFVAEQRLSIPPVLWAINGGGSAHALADRWGALWIADFKDAWDFGRFGLARGLERVATSRRLRASSAVTAASCVGAKDIRDEFGHCPEVIYTGVDLDIYASEPPRFLGEGLEVVYSGNVDEHMRLDTFVQGMAMAARSMPHASMRFHHFGYDQGGVRRTFQRHDIEANLVSHGYVDRAAAVAYQKGASLLLHLARVPAKQFSVKYLEYLAAGRPVLSVPRDPESDEDLRLRMPAAADPTEVSAHLMKLAATESNPLTPPDLSAFTWGAQTDRLEAVLDRVQQRV
jgi:glycosyltransferase involved in cell wall biosynthesis